MESSISLSNLMVSLVVVSHHSIGGDGVGVSCPAYLQCGAVGRLALMFMVVVVVAMLMMVVLMVVVMMLVLITWW